MERTTSGVGVGVVISFNSIRAKKMSVFLVVLSTEGTIASKVPVLSLAVLPKRHIPPWLLVGVLEDVSEMQPVWSVESQPADFMRSVE